MFARVWMPPGRTRAAIVRAGALPALLAAVTMLAGCGGAHAGASARASSAGVPARSCPATVLEALSRVVRHVYHEGVASERTILAQRVINASLPLREAVQRNDPAAARAAAQALIAGGHLTSLRVIRGSAVLADVGSPAVAPLSGSLTMPGGAAVARYVTSVWSDAGFLAESQGIGEGAIALRQHGRSIAGSFQLPPGRLPAEGGITLRGVRYQYASFGAKTYPTGSLRVYLVKPVSATRFFCAADSEATLVNTLTRVANQIYQGEAGRRTQPQIRRVQTNRPLLEAVARRDPRATRRAIEGLLNQHIVRLRVSAAGQLLGDVGGPYVLAPVSAQLRGGGRTIGRIVLSIQDDEGYLRLARRLAGLYVLMYMGGAHPALVKNSLGPSPGTPPDSGRYEYRGRRFSVFTIQARAFPSGPLKIQVLVPIPYA